MNCTQDRNNVYTVKNVFFKFLVNGYNILHQNVP
jgi:hypothetical protein